MSRHCFLYFDFKQAKHLKQWIFREIVVYVGDILALQKQEFNLCLNNFSSECLKVAIYYSSEEMEYVSIFIYKI